MRTEETLLVRQVPWLWLARILGRSRVKGFIEGRVGWTISAGDAVLDRFDPEEDAR